jgi:probable DNA metabolism protein
MNHSLCELFSALAVPEAEPPAVQRAALETGGLFTDTATETAQPRHKGKEVYPEDTAIISGLFSAKGMDLSILPPSAYRLYELSVNAFDIFVHAWMSELPLEAAMLRFGRKIVTAADRAAAERIACNRSDDDARLLLEAAAKVWHEIDRMRGLLRFAPNARGWYTAFCEPDHFILPALGEHFFQRFGAASWAIVDERRDLCLSSCSGEPPRVDARGGSRFRHESDGHTARQCGDSFPTEAGQWENLWLTYHQTINNESRKNPGLQRQFMPKRYWKNLPEMK